MEKEEFEKLIIEAINDLPKKIREKIKNVAICVENEANETQLKESGIRLANSLLGLYQGIPKTVWGREDVGKLPDKITIFKEPIEKIGVDRENIKELVKIVVWHEIAHYFGFSEEGVRVLENKWRSKINMEKLNNKLNSK